MEAASVGKRALLGHLLSKNKGKRCQFFLPLKSAAAAADIFADILTSFYMRNPTNWFNNLILYSRETINFLCGAAQ